MCDIPWISSFGWPDDDSLESKHVTVSIILCNKLLCLTETYILYEAGSVYCAVRTGSLNQTATVSSLKG